MREESGLGQREYANDESERCERCGVDDKAPFVVWGRW